MDEMGTVTKLSIVQVFTDSSVAKSFVSTRGLGKMRHLEVKLLWLQECVQRGRLLVGKVSGKSNIADALTKYQRVDKLHVLFVIVRVSAYSLRNYQRFAFPTEATLHCHGSVDRIHLTSVATFTG